MLEAQDAKSIGARMAEMKRGLKLQEEKENQLQMRFANLKTEKERLEKLVR